MISRRKFLRVGALATAAGIAGPGLAEVETSGPASSSLRVILQGPDGKPLDSTGVKTIIARDLANDPLPQALAIGEGECGVALASEPLQLACRLAVPGFGEVYCYADNNGKGYRKPETIEFVVEAARTRLARVQKRFKAEWHAIGRAPELERHLEGAARPIPSQPGPARMAAAYASLSDGLHAGERLVLLAAQRRIARLAQPRRDFLFGAPVSGHGDEPRFSERFKGLCNFGTMRWYTWKSEPSESAPIDYTRMDDSLQWCLDRKIVPKGYGYVYLIKGAAPEWLRSWPYEKLLPLYQRVMEQTMRRYAGRIPCAEIINEAHDKSNLFHLSHAQILELTREACQSARRGAPQVKRMINNCCMWAEYAKARNADGSRRWSPFRYLADCVKSNVEFEQIGLQLYYPQQDLFEIEAMLDRFKVFQRALHLSEVSCNSAPGLDPASMRPQSLVPGWHGPWTESMQADWAEAIYTLCYSKREFEAVEWWDLADYPGHFWPNGGLLHGDFTPKESYRRLLALKRSWGLS